MNSADIIEKQSEKIASLEEQLVAMTQQLDWFKRQLFGRKSEKQIEENPFQSSLFTASNSTTAHAEVATQTVKAHKRKSQKQSSESDVNDTTPACALTIAYRVK